MRRYAKYDAMYYTQHVRLYHTLGKAHFYNSFLCRHISDRHHSLFFVHALLLFVTWILTNRDIYLHKMKTSLHLLLSAIFVSEIVVAFTSPMFQTIPSQQIKAPSVQEGVEIELPDFDELFKRIQSVSPLAKVAIEQAGKPQNGVSHFDSVSDGTLPWLAIVICHIVYA